MKDTSQKRTNNILVWILLVLAVLAAAFAGYSYLRYQKFPTDSYNSTLEELNAQTEAVRAQQPMAQQQMDDMLAAIAAEPSQAGEEAADLLARRVELTATVEEKTEQVAALQRDIEVSKDMQGAVTQLREEYGETIRQLEDLILEGKSDKKIFYWTLDDGPTMWTKDFLQVAEETGAYLTFFTSHEANTQSKEEEEEKALERETLRAEAMGGHSIQNHTYSHQFAIQGNLYSKGVETFIDQVRQQDEWVYECTGLHTQIFRFPGGNAWAKSIVSQWHEDFQDWMDAVADEGMEWVQWNMNTYDAGEEQPEVAQEVGNVTYEAAHLGADSLAKFNTEYKFAIILSHDNYLCTLYTMKQAIPQLQAQGWIFLPLFPQSSTMGENTQIVYS